MATYTFTTLHQGVDFLVGVNAAGDVLGWDVIVFNHGTEYQAGANTVLRGDHDKEVLDGSAGHDVLNAGKGADVLIGGADDVLRGGKGPDTFLFRPGFGTSTIKDFDVHNDVVQFDKAMFQSVGDIASHTVDSSCGAEITDAQGDTVTLLGVHASQLDNHPHDFHLA
jgi:Ca2+-binding RTX toxin-like protein